MREASVSAKGRSAKRYKQHKTSSAQARKLQSPGERAAAFAHAGRLQNAGDLEGASAIYRQLLALDPANQNALFLLGLAEHGRGDQHAASAHFERLIQLQGGAAEYRLWFSRPCARGEYQRALAEARRSRELDPRQEGAYHSESLLLRDLERPLEARDLLLLGLATLPHSALLHASLGETYLLLREPCHARVALERALESTAGCAPHGSAWVWPCRPKSSPLPRNWLLSRRSASSRTTPRRTTTSRSPWRTVTYSKARSPTRCERCSSGQSAAIGRLASPGC